MPKAHETRRRTRPNLNADRAHRKTVPEAVLVPADQAPRIRHEHMPHWPRGLKIDLASVYVGLSQSTFRSQVDAREIPAPIRLTPGRLVWLREDLDNYLDRKAGRIAPISTVLSYDNAFEDFDAAQ